MTKRNPEIAENFRHGVRQGRDAEVIPFGTTEAFPTRPAGAQQKPRIPEQYRHLIFGVIQSGLTCAVAAAIASFPFYADGSFLSHWVRAYLYSWIIMLPVVVIAAPVIRKIVDAITH